MKLNIDISKKFNLKKINLNLTKELNEAGKVIRLDHITRLENTHENVPSKMPKKIKSKILFIFELNKSGI